MTDTIVIGSGIAGISASLTLKQNGVNFILLGPKNLSEKLSKPERISNYPGLSSVSGKKFASQLKKQLALEKIDVEDERATGVFQMENGYTVLTESGKEYSAKSVVLCVGVDSLKKIDGEAEFLGRGVSYCATCDGKFYEGKNIVVVASSKHFEREAKWLSSLAKTTLFVPLYKDFSKIGTEICQKMPTKIVGTKRVEKLLFDDKEVETDGVFILRSSVAPDGLCGGLETVDGHVKTDRNQKTNLDGLFVAGDITGRPYQYAKAAGEGNVAAFSVVEYLARQEK